MNAVVAIIRIINRIRSKTVCKVYGGKKCLKKGYYALAIR